MVVSGFRGPCEKRKGDMQKSICSLLVVRLSVSAGQGCHHNFIQSNLNDLFLLYLL